MLQKFAVPLVGTPFCGAPVRPNMLNMPKSASDNMVQFRNTVLKHCTKIKLSNVD